MATGNKYQTEVDSTGRESGLGFTRHYNSLLANDTGLGTGWTAPFGKSLAISGNNVHVQSGNGHGEYFVCYGGTCTGDADTKIQIAPDASGYTLTHRDKSSERYDLTGKIVSETDSASRTTNYGYDGSNRLSTVTDFSGHALTFGYNSSNRVATITDPAGKIIYYDYDDTFPTPVPATPVGNLTRVRYPDGTAKIYHYNETSLTSGANLPHYLTGISYVDANNATTRFSSYEYYYNLNNAADPNNGKAIRTEHAITDNVGPQEKFTLAYNSNTQTTVTDPVNMQNVMTFAVNLGVKNLVSKTSSIDTKSLQQTFDTNNNLTCRKDEENHVTLYSYNPTNQKLSMTEGLSGTDCNACINSPSSCNVGGTGRVTTYDYVSTTLDLPRFIRRPSVASGQTYETEIQYGDTTHPNLPTNIIQRGYTPLGASVSRTVTLGYNASGQVSSIDGPRTDVADITTLQYYSCTTGGACGQLSRVTNALGHVTTYDSHDANGRLLQMTDPNGLKTSYTYDARGRVKAITQTPTSGSAAITQYNYTAWGDVAQVIDPDGVKLTYQYDTAHDLRYIVDAAGNYLHYTYDLKGNCTGESVYDSSGVLKRTLSQAYDLRNHLSSITSAGNTTQLVFDAVGDLTRETDGNNHATQHQYDALNRLMQTVDALNGVTGYASDINDRPSQVTAPNNLSTQYSYDDLGNLLQEISPDRKTTAYVHDEAGNVTTITDARGKITTYAYDALNRVIEQSSSDVATPLYDYTYDDCSVGRLCYVWLAGNVHIIYSYDTLGRRNYELDDNWLYTLYAYTPGGRLAQITYPDGRVVDYQYDTMGRIAQVSTTANSVTTVLASNLQYYPFGPAKSLTLGNGKTLTALVDSAYRPTFRSDGPAFENITAYDGNDNVTQLYAPGLKSFGYDPLDRLTQATDAQSGSYGSLSYLYDTNSNRSSETRNGTATNYAYNPAGSNWLYQIGTDYRLRDAAGNTQWSSATYSLTYDGYGRLTSASRQGAAYGYNALNQRTLKTVTGNTTAFHYGPRGELLYESDNTGAKAYVYLNDKPLARLDNGTTIYYYHTDHLGTPQAMTDSTGTTVWKATYEPFGKVTVTTQTVINNLRMAGMVADQETGWYYWGARYYDPKTGRGISADGMSVAEHVARWQANMGVPNQPPLELNLYVAVANNPLRWIDPDGLETKLNLFEGANGAGHLGLQIGSDPSKGKYPQSSDALTRLKNLFSVDVPGKIAQDDPTHLIDSITLQTTSDEENKLKSCVNKFQGTAYDLYSNSCVAPPKKCLSEIGVKLDSSIIPKIIFRNLKMSLPQSP